MNNEIYDDSEFNDKDSVKAGCTVLIVAASISAIILAVLVCLFFAL